MLLSVRTLGLDLWSRSLWHRLLLPGTVLGSKDQSTDFLVSGASGSGLGIFWLGMEAVGDEELVFEAQRWSRWTASSQAWAGRWHGQGVLWDGLEWEEGIARRPDNRNTLRERELLGWAQYWLQEGNVRGWAERLAGSQAVGHWEEASWEPQPS